MILGEINIPAFIASQNLGQSETEKPKDSAFVR